jgi:hypothetical protein
MALITFENVHLLGLAEQAIYADLQCKRNCDDADYCLYNLEGQNLDMVSNPRAYFSSWDLQKVGNVAYIALYSSVPRHREMAIELMEGFRKYRNAISKNANASCIIS